MKTILMTAYAVDPYKGSEEGTGWNLVTQAARHHEVIAITRKNNRTSIEKFLDLHRGTDPRYDRVSFMYYDWPSWLIFWKKGPLLSALYFYLWQMGVALWLWRLRPSFDIAHSVNFHSNWTPSFLWILRKPFVWGPVGHHPPIPKVYVKDFYGRKANWKDKALAGVKWFFWNLDPFLYLSRKKAKKVFVVNSEAGEKLRLHSSQKIFMPAVASETPESITPVSKEKFVVLSVGRFVPLKGFDLSIKAFARFYQQLHPVFQRECQMQIIGKGPEKERLQELIHALGMEQVIQIHDWMPRSEVIRLFQQSAVYLFPSHEGAGMVVAEALSYGLPVVALDNAGPGEYISPRSALRVEMGGYQETVEQLAERLKWLYQDPSLYNQEKQWAQERYAELFRWDIKGETLKKVYEELPLEMNLSTL